MQANSSIIYEEPLKQVILYFSGEQYSESDIGGDSVTLCIVINYHSKTSDWGTEQPGRCERALRGSHITNPPRNEQGDRIFSAQNCYVKTNFSAHSTKFPNRGCVQTTI